MAGSGPLEAALRESAKRHGVNLRLLGNVPHLDLPGVLRSSAIFALVSPHEGHPKALLEAMSCGLAVVGADSPGIRELIRHGETGWLCKKDPSSIRAALRTLLERREVREAMGRSARRFVVEGFALERMVELELALVKDLATGIRGHEKGTPQGS
jgi:glycosyltransferase involved in cell wall biosynthesis